MIPNPILIIVLLAMVKLLYDPQGRLLINNDTNAKNVSFLSRVHFDCNAYELNTNETYVITCIGSNVIWRKSIGVFCRSVDRNSSFCLLDFVLGVIDWFGGKGWG